MPTTATVETTASSPTTQPQNWTAVSIAELCLFFGRCFVAMLPYAFILGILAALIFA